jgi:hypothetical protein
MTYVNFWLWNIFEEVKKNLKAIETLSYSPKLIMGGIYKHYFLNDYINLVHSPLSEFAILDKFCNI